MNDFPINKYRYPEKEYENAGHLSNDKKRSEWTISAQGGDRGPSSYNTHSKLDNLSKN